MGFAVGRGVVGLVRSLGIIFLLLVLMRAVPGSAQQAGEGEYHQASHVMRFYTGSQWYEFGIGASLGGCAKEGEMDYDPIIISAYKYCNGTNWVHVVGIPTIALCGKVGEMNFTGSTYLVCNGTVWTDIKGLPSL